MATTNFDEWINGNVFDIEEAYFLEQCIFNKVDEGPYTISINEEKKFIKNHGESLLIASEKAERMFLKMLESRFADPDLDIETTLDFKRAMEKDD